MPLFLQAAAVAPKQLPSLQGKEGSPNSPSLCCVCRPGQALGPLQEQGWPRGRWHQLDPHSQPTPRSVPGAGPSMDVLCAPARGRHQSRAECTKQALHPSGMAATCTPLAAFHDSCQRSLLLWVTISTCRSLSPCFYSPATRRNS